MLTIRTYTASLSVYLTRSRYLPTYDSLSISIVHQLIVYDFPSFVFHILPLYLSLLHFLCLTNFILNQIYLALSFSTHLFYIQALYISLPLSHIGISVKNIYFCAYISHWYIDISANYLFLCTYLRVRLSQSIHLGPP